MKRITAYSIDRVSRQEQEEIGALRPASRSYVPATPERRVSVPPAQHSVAHVIDAPLSATQHIEVRTSATDRAKGFLIATVPLYAAFALGVVLVAYLLWDTPILSWSALLIFWLSFVAAWLMGYVWTITISAEGVAFYEAKQKWNIIKREQTERWDYYRGQIDGD